MKVSLSNEQGLVTHDRVWIAIFILAFLGLMVDDTDLTFLSYNLLSPEQEFGLPNMEAGAPGNVTLAGMVIGGTYGEWTADRFGRVHTVIWTILVSSAGTAASGLTHNFTQSTTLRPIASLGLGVEYVARNTLMAEYVPAERRTMVLGTLQVGWSVGYVAATLFVGWILPAFGWRWLSFTTIIPVVITVLV